MHFYLHNHFMARLDIDRNGVRVLYLRDELAKLTNLSVGPSEIALRDIEATVREGLRKVVLTGPFIASSPAARVPGGMIREVMQMGINPPIP